MDNEYSWGYVIDPSNRNYVLKNVPENSIKIFGNLILAKKPLPHGYWANSILSGCALHEFTSVSQAARILWSLKKKWFLIAQDYHRRCTLIQEKVRTVDISPSVFPMEKDTDTGIFSLVDKHLLFTATEYDSIFPAGMTNFKENKTDPPNRAYLKLWEALCYLKKKPGPGSLCLDIGASPGGWTWVLLECGARVISVDRSPLQLHNSQKYTGKLLEETGNAFLFVPEKTGKINYLFSDLACYPDKLYDFITTWVKSGMCNTFICTLKMQKTPDWSAIEKFSSFEGSQIRHLFHNKHELTWIYEK